jgi:tetratricopeptide (TPR) repeat protein
MDSLAPEDVVRQVAALLDRRRIELARALLKSALANHPDHSGLLLQSAWTDYLADQNEEALTTVRQVLASEPSNESARVLYFELLVEKGQHRDAEHVIIELLREYPEASDYYGRYANLMLRTLNITKALQLAREGLRYEPDNTECLAAQAICELIERPGSASHGLQRLLVGHPKYIRTLLLVVVALEQRGDVRGAKQVAQELVLAQPNNERLVAIARDLKLKAHWSMLPLWPIQKWGWGASFGIWLFTIVASRALDKTHPEAASVFLGVMLTYVVYSWVWPPLLRRFFFK